MSRRVAWVVLALVVAEAGYFLVQNRDVVALSRAAGTLAVDPQFGATARRVLARPHVTRRVLERIADAATRVPDPGLQLIALERMAADAPADRDVQLRLAEALRAGGRLAEAEAIFRRYVGASERGGQ